MGNTQAKHNLWVAISANDPLAVRDLVQKYPFLLNEPISDDGKTNAVTRAAYLNRPHILAELVSLGVDLNSTTSTKISALMWAATKGHLDSLKFLLEYGTDPTQTDPHGLNALDFAVLYGRYNAAYFLYSKGIRCNKTAEDFQQLKEELQTLWVDYSGLMVSLTCNIPPEVAPPFTVPPPKKEPVFIDPVSDPNETWKNWAKRIIDFEEPPLVERNSLPYELQPQNTKIGRLKILLRMETDKPEGIENEFSEISESRISSADSEARKDLKMV
ncbi:unnamed protein product [Blepharisma stoltei]|uniref:Ankyrin repeat domain-containing protein n=1 Tax=Blepharisma stoltei TaxID=1481888 RepID=A0AAU9IS03_9CILI|nr:unnamed protein product [Blepharisma stoltei]